MIFVGIVPIFCADTPRGWLLLFCFASPGWHFWLPKPLPRRSAGRASVQGTWRSVWYLCQWVLEALSLAHLQGLRHYKVLWYCLLTAYRPLPSGLGRAVSKVRTSNCLSRSWAHMAASPVPAGLPRYLYPLYPVPISACAPA